MTKSFVVLFIGNSKSNHLGARGGTFSPTNGDGGVEAREGRRLCCARRVNPRFMISKLDVNRDGGMGLGRSGPNLKPGTVRVCGMRGLRTGMHTTQHPPSPISRAWNDPPTNVQAVSRAVCYVNTHRPRIQVRARPS